MDEIVMIFVIAIVFISILKIKSELDKEIKELQESVEDLQFLVEEILER